MSPPAILRRSTNRTFVPGAGSLLLVAILIVGCGAPGEPVAPIPPMAAPIKDLSGRQAGDSVQLAFTMPTRSVAGDRLLSTPAIEILRGTTKSDGSPDLNSLKVLDIVPAALADKYLNVDQFQFADPVESSQTTHPGGILIYAVRSRLSRKRSSANSNIISIRIFSPPARIASIQSAVTETAITLSWLPVDRTSAGEQLTLAPNYNIYRAELDTADAAVITNEGSRLPSNAKLKLLASQPENHYSDKSFEFGKTYAYIVRSIAGQNSTTIESSDSAPAIVTPRDTFPPAAPQALSAVILPGENPDTSIVELSWSINVEPDFAGYRVYRSDDPGLRGQLLTTELLFTPAYRDTSAQTAHRYWYTVTAVDRTGNESPSSSPAAVETVPPTP